MNKVIAVSGPSGSGKTSLAKPLLSDFIQLQFSISATTRSPRLNEKNGIDYYFLSLNDFKKNIDNKAFVEYEEVYPGLFYGTLWSEIERIQKEHKIPLLDVDVYGALNIKKIYKQEALLIMIHPRDIENLIKRLTSRKTESEESLKLRIDKAMEELSLKNKFDQVIYNDGDLENSQLKIKQVVKEFIL